MASMRRTPSSRSRTFRRALIGAAALSLIAATEASAQFAYGYMRAYPGPAYDDVPPMPPRAVVYRLQDRGFTEIARPRFDGRAYVVDATNPAGNRIRLFVDARDGGVIGRQRLDSPYYPSARVARSAPGYGWTEEDVAPRRGGRDPEGRDREGRGREGLLPPGDIPLPRPSLHAEIERAPAVSSRPGAPDAGTFGVNPDGRPAPKGDKARAATAPRKTAKLTPPVKPAAPRAAPEAPLPQMNSVEPAGPNANATPDAAKTPAAETPAAETPAARAPDVAKTPEPVTAAIEPPKVAPAPLTPAANQPAAAEKPPEAPAPKAVETPATEKPTEKAAVGKPAEEKHADKAPTAETPPAKSAANQGWQDPPAGDQKRNVRVIGGAIVVPGGGEAAPAAAN